MNIKTTKIVALVAFDGSNDACDPAGAAVALARQGFWVTLMPEAFRAMLDVPGDDHLEAAKNVPGDPAEPSNKVSASCFAVSDGVADEVNAIVSHFGGDCHECGPEDDDYVAEFCGLTERAKTELAPA